MPVATREFGKYRLLRLIGRGGMGTVYLAEDQMLGRRVALKVLDRTLTASPGFEERFQREARVIASLDHPHIIRIHSLERIEGELAIDMNYVEGGSLAEELETGRLPMQRALPLMVGVLEALAACHAEGVVHRDVKPANILLASPSRALLSDFGLAKLMAEYQALSFTQSSSTGFFVGTPRYAPPEAWEDGALEPTWDVYSSGVVFYESLSGQQLYKATSPMMLVREMVEQPLPRLAEVLPEVSAPLAGLLESMLQRQPSARPQDAGEVLRALFETPEWKESVTQEGATFVPRRRFLGVTHWRRLRRTVATRLRKGSVILVGLGLLLGVAAAWYLVPSTRERISSAPVPLPDVAAFDSVDPMTAETTPASWVVQRAPQGEGLALLEVQGTRLSYLSAEPARDGGWVLKGHWAEYGDYTARVFRYGSVEGSGAAFSSAGATFSLEYRSTPDGSRATRLLSLTPSEAPATPAACLARFQEAEYVQPLLYNELVPRGLPPVAEVELFWRRLGAARLTARSLAGETIRVDGVIEERPWLALRSKGPSVLPDSTAPARDGDGIMAAACDSTALYLGFRATRPLPSPRLVVGIQDGFTVPASSSPRRLVSLEQGGVSSHTLSRSEGELSWDCAWQYAERSAGGAWEAEIVIPFSDFDAPVRPGDRWRLNCAVKSLDEKDKPLSLGWGAADPKDLARGILLVFEAPSQAPAEVSSAEASR